MAQPSLRLDAAPFVGESGGAYVLGGGDVDERRRARSLAQALEIDWRRRAFSSAADRPRGPESMSLRVEPLPPFAGESGGEDLVGESGGERDEARTAARSSCALLRRPEAPPPGVAARVHARRLAAAGVSQPPLAPALDERRDAIGVPEARRDAAANEARPEPAAEERRVPPGVDAGGVKADDRRRDKRARSSASFAARAASRAALSHRLGRLWYTAWR